MGEDEIRQIMVRIQSNLDVMAMDAHRRAAENFSIIDGKKKGGHHCYKSIKYEFLQWCNKSYKRAVACAAGITLLMSGIGWCAKTVIRCAKTVITSAANERWVPKTEWQKNQELFQKSLNDQIAETNRRVDDRITSMEKSVDKIAKMNEKMLELMLQQNNKKGDKL